ELGELVLARRRIRHLAQPFGARDAVRERALLDKRRLTREPHLAAGLHGLLGLPVLDGALDRDRCHGRELVGTAERGHGAVDGGIGRCGADRAAASGARHDEERDQAERSASHHGGPPCGRDYRRRTPALQPAFSSTTSTSLLCHARYQITAKRWLPVGDTCV